MDPAAVIRPAGREDVAAVVRLRLANADRHIELDPAGAAERVAAAHGVELLIAPILAGNDSAVRFYTAAGYAEHSTLLSKEPGPGLAG